VRVDERVLLNESFGERVTFLRTAEDTGGEFVECELELSKEGAGPGDHAHPQQEERFHVLAGALALRIAGHERVLGPGDEAVVHPGIPHAWTNVSPVTTIVRLVMRPALRFEEALEEVFRMQDEGGWNDAVAVAAFAERYGDEFTILGPT